MDKLGVRMKKFKNTLLVGFFKNQSKSNIFTKEIPVNFTGNSFVNFTGISFVKLTSISFKWDFPYTWSEFWKNVFFWFWQKFRGISYIIWRQIINLEFLCLFNFNGISFIFDGIFLLPVTLQSPSGVQCSKPYGEREARVVRVGVWGSKGSFNFPQFQVC